MLASHNVRQLVILVGIFTSQPAMSAPLPGGQDSDVIAWQVFAQITAPSGNPQVKKVEFETWASDEDIYKTNPPAWPTINAPKVLQNSILGLARSVPRRITPFVFTPGSCSLPRGLPTSGPGSDAAAVASGFPANSCIGEEVRRNWASFQYIVSNQLYSKSGLAQAFSSGFKVNLPADSIEFKGDWAIVADVAKWLSVDPSVIRGHYYTSSSTINGSVTEIALLSFHISTKQISNWVWSDFEGGMNPGRCDDIGCHDSFGAVISDVPSNSAPYKPYSDCVKKAALVDMLQNAGIDAIWQNYCLKGTQITFTNGSTQTRLGNSIIEPLNAGVPISNSSCITCHGYASFGQNGAVNFFALLDPLNSPIGDLDPTHLQGNIQNDFIWGIADVPQQ